MTIAACDGPGCVIFVVDESAEMDSPVQDDSQVGFGQQAKPKGDAIATALNALLRQLTSGPNFETAIIGYRTDSDGAPIATSRWGGRFAGRDFVNVNELSQNPIVIEKRTRRIPDTGSLTGFREESVDFPVWYVPQRGGTSPMVNAFQQCRQLLLKWQATASPKSGTPLIINIFGGDSSDGDPLGAIEEIHRMPFPAGLPLIFNVHLANSKLVQATLFSSNRMFLPVGVMRDVFGRTSPLPENLINALKATKTPVGPNARGMAFNARMSDVVKFLSLVKTHTKDWPSRDSAHSVAIGQAATGSVAETVAAVPVSDVPTNISMTAEVVSPEAVAPELALAQPAEIGNDSIASAADQRQEKSALVVVLLDRSLADPNAGDTHSAFSRLCEHANDLISKISKKASGQIDIAIVSYGQDAVGDVEVRSAWEGNLAGRRIVRDSELASGALRVEEVETQVPNGVGGVMTIPIRKSIFVELEPTLSTSPIVAFETVRSILDEWVSQHRAACVSPLIVHLTRGRQSPSEMDTAVAQIQSAEPNQQINLYHLIATEDPHPSQFYLESELELQTPELRHLWTLTSPLLDRESLAASKPSLVKPESRGIVVNGKFDLLLEGLTAALN